MPRIVHFELHADDPERAMTFYRACFGWEFNQWEGPFDYWLITTGPKEEMGIDGGLVKRTTPINGEGIIAFVCTMAVEDLDATLKSVEENGGKIAVAKDTIPGVGWLAYFEDTEGNIVGAMQPDMSVV